VLIGGFIIAISLFLASISQKLWHLYLTQGLLYGIGGGMAYFPAVGIVPEWVSDYFYGLQL